VQVCTSLQTDNHTSTSPLSFFTGRMPFLPPNQQHQSTEGKPDLDVILFCRTVVDAECCGVFHGVLREELRVDAPADGRREPPAQCHR